MPRALNPRGLLIANPKLARLNTTTPRKDPVSQMSSTLNPATACVSPSRGSRLLNLWLLSFVLATTVFIPHPASAQWTTGSGGAIYYNGGKVGVGLAPGYQFDVKTTNQWDGIGVRNATNVVAWIGGNSASAEDGQINLLSNGVLKAVIASRGYSFFTGGNVGIGTANPQYTLSVNGSIGAWDIVVTNTGWSDYVFRPDYRLRPLSEVSHYIKKNGHLPDIPTEAEVKQKGVSLGDMQSKLLAKVEELTLHLIDQEQQNQQLRERLIKLEKLVHTKTLDNSPLPAGN